MASLIPDPKAPSAVIACTLDYTAELAEGDTIASSAWSVPAGLTQSNASHDSVTATVDIGGGADLADYVLVNTVTTAQGLSLVGYVSLRVRDPAGAGGSIPVSKYAQIPDMVARFGEQAMIDLTDDGFMPIGEIDPVKAGQALADADAAIDGYLIARYDLPLATIPAMLPVIACDIARYRLARLPTEEMRARHGDALAWLDKVARGQYGLGLDAANEPTPEGASDGPMAATSCGFAPQRVFTAGSLCDYRNPAYPGYTV